MRQLAAEVHFAVDVGQSGRYAISACEHLADAPLWTCKPDGVTCGNCQRTKKFKDAVAATKPALPKKKRTQMRQRGVETHFISHWVHGTVWGVMACGRWARRPLVTRESGRATCRSCQRTKRFKKALAAKEKR